jgi:hypothetical protein
MFAVVFGYQPTDLWYRRSPDIVGNGEVQFVGPSEPPRQTLIHRHFGKTNQLSCGSGVVETALVW